MLLRLFGANVGREVHIHPSAKIMIPWNLSIADQASVGDCVRLYNLGKLFIGARSCISQGAHLCGGTHDYRKRELPLVRSIIRIEDDVWICADAFIGPDVTVGRLAVVGARAVVVDDVAQSTIVAGNPARFIKNRPVLE